jgi:diguanylate cyclase (GGDEF)-like protein
MADEDVPQATATAPVAAPEVTTDTASPALAAPAPALGPAGPLIDPGSGLPTRIAWEVALGREEPRFARYRRLVSIVVVELDGLVALAERLGQPTADRLLPPVATTLSRFARRADLVAQVDQGRFLLMLPETDEVAVINYVERVREACDMWLSTGAVSVRLAIGWASPPPGGTLADAFRIAEERMQADRRHGEGRGPAGVADPR